MSRNYLVTKLFSEDPSKGSRDQKCTRMWWFEAFFSLFHFKNDPEAKFLE